MTANPKTIREKIQESIEEIRSTADIYLAHEDRSFGLVIWGNGLIDLRHLNDALRGLPEVHFGVGQILNIPGCIPTDSVANFVEEHIDLFNTVCEEIEVGHDSKGNQVGNLSEEGQAAFEKLAALAESLQEEADDRPTEILDPEMMFDAVRHELANEATPEDAIKVAYKWAEDAAREYSDVRYVIDYDVIKKYAVDAWHDVSSPDEDDEE